MQSKHILHIIPYTKLYPPQNGGQLRCYYLMMQLARFHSVDVILYQNKNDFNFLKKTNQNINFINGNDYPLKEGIFSLCPERIKNSLRYRWLTLTLFESASKEVLEFSHLIKALSTNTSKYDIVVCEHLSALSLSPIIRRYLPNAQIVLDAHNIDYKLLTNRKEKFRTYRKERKIYKKADHFWACSHADTLELEQMNQQRIKGSVVANGVDASSRPYHEDKSLVYQSIIFCGSLEYKPNQDGLHWFYKEVWELIKKQLPSVTLTVIGHGNTTPFEELKNDSSIHFIGAVDDVVPYYRNSYIAIVPLLSGSGTRLKVLEAMSLGNPIVTTTIGIEGIDAINNVHTLIGNDPKHFAECVINIISDHDIGNRIRKNARNLIDQKYVWNQIGNLFSQI